MRREESGKNMLRENWEKGALRDPKLFPGGVWNKGKIWCSGPKKGLGIIQSCASKKGGRGGGGGGKTHGRAAADERRKSASKRAC